MNGLLNKNFPKLKLFPIFTPPLQKRVVVVAVRVAMRVRVRMCGGVLAVVRALNQRLGGGGSQRVRGGGGPLGGGGRGRK
jgi:uncharacterized membrane protein YgcG